jgi:hypothetical protein
MTKKAALGCFSLAIGCGLTSQRDLCKCDEIVGVDIDKKKIFEARKSDQLAHYVICDARFLPLRPGRFEDIVCTDVLEHIAEYERVLINMVKLKPHFIYLRYPTEVREKLLIKGSKVYREQHWGKIHVTIVKTEKIVNLLKEEGYEISVGLTPATSTFNRLILQVLLEKLGIRYEIPDLGFISFSENRRLYRFLAWVSSLMGSIGYLTYFLWRYLKIATIHDNYIVRAALHDGIQQ